MHVYTYMYVHNIKICICTYLCLSLSLSLPPSLYPYIYFNRDTHTGMYIYIYTHKPTNRGIVLKGSTISSVPYSDPLRYGKTPGNLSVMEGKKDVEALAACSSLLRFLTASSAVSIHQNWALG